MRQFLVIATVPLQIQLPDELQEGFTVENVMEPLLEKLGYSGPVIHSIEEIPDVKQ